MLRNPFTKAIWDSRWALLGWTIGIVGVAAMYAGSWISIGQNPNMIKAMQNYPSSLKAAFSIDDLTTPSGYLRGSVYGVLLEILVTIFAVVAGTRAIAGDEDAGTLDLVLAQPVSRTRLALQRFAALTSALIAISVLLWLVMVALSRPARLDGITPLEFAAMNAQLALFGVCMAAIAFAIGGATGRRTLTLGASAGLAVVGYLMSGLIPRIRGLGWVRDLTPFYWYLGGDPLDNGFQGWYALLLLGASVALVAAGLWLFNHRDVASR
jgi:ABC-2 type transport system permease protein